MRNVSDANSCWKNAAVSSLEPAMTVPDGMPRTTSSAWLGPESTANRSGLPISEANTSMGSMPLPSSTPLEQMMTGKS